MHAEMHVDLIVSITVVQFVPKWSVLTNFSSSMQCQAQKKKSIQWFLRDLQRNRRIDIAKLMGPFLQLIVKGMTERPREAMLTTPPLMMTLKAETCG